MRFWAFNDKCFRKSEQTLELKSRRRVWVKGKDKVLLFNRTSKGLIFESFGRIGSATLEDLGDDGYLFKAIVEDYEVFEEERYLEDFIYSLQKIYRFQKPLLHFRRPYIELSKNDFFTIVESRIYWARTGFGLFINELPRDHLVRFMSQLAETAPDVLLQRTGYTRAWKLLREFIEDEYISAAEVFAGIRKTINKLNQNEHFEMDFSKISLLSDDDDDSPDSIELQDQLFSKFTDLLLIEDSSLDLLHEIDSKLEQGILSEETFEEIFEGTPWPIQTTEE